MKLIKTCTLLAAFSVATAAHGAVVLQDTYAPAAQLGAPTDIGGGTFGYDLDLTGDFSAAGNGKLVMVLSGKDEDGGDLAGAPVTGITYDGVALNQILFNADGNRVSVGIYYLDNVATDGNLRIEFADGNQSEFGFGLYALDGLKAGVQDSDTFGGSGTPTASVDLTTTEGFIVQEAARNNQSLSGAADEWTDLYSYSAQSYRALSQYQLVTTGPGTGFSAPINNTGSFKRVSIAAFEAVPEPSSLALLALGSLMVARRRRD